MLCALATWICGNGHLAGQTKEAPESVEPPLQITSDGAFTGKIFGFEKKEEGGGFGS